MPLWEALAIVLCLAASFFFAGTETALTSLSEARTRQLIEESGRQRHPLQLWLKHPERVITTLLFGNTLANIGASAITTDIVTRTGTHYAVAIATGATTFVVLTFCEITPKTLAKRHPVGVSQLVGRLVVLIYWLLFPFTFLLAHIGAGLAMIFGGRKREASVTGAEIEYLIDLGSREGVLDDVKKQLLSSVLEFADLLVKEVMVPRTRIIGIEKRASFEQALKVVADSDHSRIPIYDVSVDNIVGILFVKDLARDMQNGLSAQTFKLEKYVKPSFFVPELMKISRLLREFQRRKTHLAVVVDEFGGTSGIVSLEDVVEEIVGEIQDEYDVEEKAVKALPDGRFLADGAAPLRECREALGVEFPEEGDYETLGGFLTAASGKVPAVGSMVVWNGLTFLIRAADERRVAKVEITRMKDGAAVEGTRTPVPPATVSPPKGS
jgi:CBS domain containing-hemolysin-like protein